MEENKPTETETKEESLSIVEEAKKLRDEIRAENDRRENLLREEQKLQAEKLLGSSAGQPPIPKEVSEEQRKKEAAKEFWKGTGLDEAIEKYG